MKAKPSQGKRLVQLLKRRAMTYREMLAASESYSPWRRVIEALAADEQVVNGKRGPWTTWRVIKATRWTA